jgi:hypothetical protein
MLLAVKVVPKASKSEIVGWENDVLKIRIKAVPEKGKANEELIDFLSETLDIPKSHISLVGGKTSRNKKVKLDGISSDAFQEKIKAILTNRERKTD